MSLSFVISSPNGHELIVRSFLARLARDPRHYRQGDLGHPLFVSFPHSSRPAHPLKLTPRPFFSSPPGGHTNTERPFLSQVLKAQLERELAADADASASGPWEVIVSKEDKESWSLV